MALRAAQERLIREGRFVFDAWFRVVGDHFEWYIKTFQSGKGMSLKALPEGETAVFTIDVRGQKPVTTAFANFVRDTIIAKVSHGLAFGESGDETAATRDKGASDAARLIKSLDACAPSYNEGKIREFREWLKSNAEQVDAHGQVIPLVLPDHLRAFSSHLAALRAAYAADATLFGSIATASQVCIDVAAQTSVDESKRRAIFWRLASRLVVGDVFHPVRIVDGVIQQAIDDGFVGPLLDLADGYEQKVRGGITAARSSKSIDDFLDKLYELVPRAFGARLIYTRLVANPSRLSPEQGSVMPNRLTAADEALVRVSGTAFHAQLSDFDGKHWESYCHRLRGIWQTGGEKAARDATKDLELLLVYPPSVIDDLVREAA